MGGIWRRLLTCSEWATSRTTILQAPTFDDLPPSSLRIYGARPAMHGHLQQSSPPQKVLVSVSLQSCLYLIFRLYLYISIISSTRIHLFSSISLLYSISLFIFFLLATHRASSPSHRLSTYLPPLPYFPPSPHSLTPPTLPTPSPTPPSPSTHLRPAIYIGHSCSPCLG